MLCPKCKTEMTVEGEMATCTACGARYQLNEHSAKEATEDGKDTTEPYFFISYKSENRPLADILLAGLREYGIKYWIAPEGIPVGGTYAGAIEPAIGKCFGVILLLSQAACRSPQVSREIERCVSHGKLLLPLLLEKELKFPDEYKYYFANCQFSDISSDCEGGLRLAAESAANYVHSYKEGLFTDNTFSVDSFAADKLSGTKISTARIKALVCVSCGGTRFKRNDTDFVCEKCGTLCVPDDNPPEYTVDLRLADRLRQSAKFTEAKALYSQVIMDNPGCDLTAAYWGMLLCEHNVFFEVDGKGECFPSFYRVAKERIYNSTSYRTALKCAAVSGSEERLKALGERIEFARQKYWEISESTPPYDIFICFRNDGGECLQLATELYNEFSSKYQIFFSERTLKHLSSGQREWEPNIYYGLYTARVMLLICGKREQLEGEDGKWVRNEWSRYLAINGKNTSLRTIIPIFANGFDPYNLPDELCHLQGLFEGRTLFLDLAKQLKTYLGGTKSDATAAELLELKKKQEEQAELLRKQQEEQAEEFRKQQEALRRELLSKNSFSDAKGISVSNLIDKARLELEDGAFETSEATCQEISRINIRCAEMWWIRFLISQKARSEMALIDVCADFYDNEFVVKALRFADENEQATYTAVLDKALRNSAMKAEQLIAQFSSTPVSADISAIQIAQKSFESLSEREKGYVNVDAKEKLLKCISAIPILQARERIKPFNAMLTDIPQPPTFSDVSAIRKAKEEYDSLSKYEKSYICAEAKEKLDSCVSAIPFLVHRQKLSELIQLIKEDTLEGIVFSNEVIATDQEVQNLKNGLALGDNAYYYNGEYYASRTGITISRIVVEQVSDTETYTDTEYVKTLFGKKKIDVQKQRTAIRNKEKKLNETYEGYISVSRVIRLSVKREGKSIYFGTYPQTKVTNESLASALATAAGAISSWDSYDYYIEGSIGNYMVYKDITHVDGYKYRGVYFNSYRPYYTYYSSSVDNSYQLDNGYTINTVYWFRYDPLKWDIVTENGGYVTIVADSVLDSQNYYVTSDNSVRTIDGNVVYENNYEYSTIRKWLNDNFCNTAFTRLQQSVIQTVTADNSAFGTGDGSNPYACNDTSDKIWLLSYNEAFKTYFNSDTTRQRQGTEYAKAQGLYVTTRSSSSGNSYWWLRSPYFYDSNSASGVSGGGGSGNGLVNRTGGGVLPALRISLD